MSSHWPPSADSSAIDNNKSVVHKLNVRLDKPLTFAAMQPFKHLVVFGLVAIVILSLTEAAIPEVPHVNVTLSGGPSSGKVKEGQNFLLNCTFKATYPKNNSLHWKTKTTFWLDGDELGEYRKMKTNNSYLDLEQRAMHWVTAPKLTKGVNVFPVNQPVDSYETSYSIVVQPLSKKKARDDYECSVTLENEYFTRVRFWSNKLDYSGSFLS